MLEPCALRGACTVLRGERSRETPLLPETSRPGLGHQVDVLRLKYGCEAGKYGRRCRHLVLAIQYDDWRRRQQALAAASSARPAGMAALQEAF